MSAAKPSAGVEPKVPRAGAPFTTRVFEVIAARMADRAGTIALFTETGGAWEPWSTWEALAACREAGWAPRPQPSYAEAGVAGSRETADLLVFDPAAARGVLVEIAAVHDWTTNKWIDRLNGDTDRLRRAAAAGTPGLQLILAAALDSPVDVNEARQGWLGLSAIWNEPTKLKRAVKIGEVGQLLVRGWLVK